MPKGNRPLAVRRKPPVQLFNVVFGQGDPSAVNPCPTRQLFQSQPPRKSVPEQRTGKRTRRTRTNDSRHVEIAVGHSHPGHGHDHLRRSEEHTSELQSLMRISYAVFCLKKKKEKTTHNKN